MSAPTLAPYAGGTRDRGDAHERARRREDAIALLEGVRLARSRGSRRAGRALRQSALHLRTVRST